MGNDLKNVYVISYLMLSLILLAHKIHPISILQMATFNMSTQNFYMLEGYFVKEPVSIMVKFDYFWSLRIQSVVFFKHFSIHIISFRFKF